MTDINQLRRLTSVNDLTDADVETICTSALELKYGEHPCELFKGKVLGLMFYEPSTRTEMSFSSAAQRLGAGVIGFNDPSLTSARKGESFTDTVRVMAAMCDGLVLRHPANGMSAVASAVSGVPVINAGDGTNEHPSQALCDLVTMRERFSDLDGLNVEFFGDYESSRPAHSLRALLARFGCRVTVTEGLRPNLSQLQVLYVLRPQIERHGTAMDYSLTLDDLTAAPSDLVVMHALPRTSELAVEVDDTPYAAYFEQVDNAVPVRMAILRWLWDSPTPARKSLKVDDNG